MRLVADVYCFNESSVNPEPCSHVTDMTACFTIRDVEGENHGFEPLRTELDKSAPHPEARVLGYSALDTGYQS